VNLIRKTLISFGLSKGRTCQTIYTKKFQKIIKKYKISKVIKKHNYQNNAASLEQRDPDFPSLMEIRRSKVKPCRTPK